MAQQDILELLRSKNVSPWRMRLAQWIESKRIHTLVVAVIVLNAVILGLETDAEIMASQWGPWLKMVDRLCLGVFIVEILLKMVAFRMVFWRSGWNAFDFFVVAVALIPGGGAWAVLRSLRVLRVLRLLTMIPSLRRVVAAFIHSIPGLGGVVMVMAIFFFTAGVLATNLFGETHPQWFGSLGGSLYTLFQVMTLEGWSMDIVRPVMTEHPYAWAFFVPFIIIATFTILNLFIGIIVTTMQELHTLPVPDLSKTELMEVMERMDEDLKKLRASIERERVER